MPYRHEIPLIAKFNLRICIFFHSSSLPKSSNIGKLSEFRKRSRKAFRAALSNIALEQQTFHSNYVDICSHEVRAFVSSATEQIGEG